MDATPPEQPTNPPRPRAGRIVMAVVGRLVRATAWGAVLAAWGALLFAYLWPQDYRDASSPYLEFARVAFMTRVFQFHIGLALLPVAIVAPFVRGRRLFVGAALPVLFLLGPACLSYLPRVRESGPPAPGMRLRVMTANVHLMNSDYAGLTDQVRARDPDVLLLQEFSPQWQVAVNAAVGARYPHRHLVADPVGTGMGMYSKLPFRGRPSSTVAPGVAHRTQLRAVLDVGGGREVVLYNLHLRSPRARHHVIDGRTAFADLCAEVAAERRPMILAGDFNFPETAPQHAALRRLGLREAHADAGRGRGSTWCHRGPLSRYPGLRIDHVYFTGGAFTAVACDLGTFYGSDHVPVIADLVLRR